MGAPESRARGGPRERRVQRGGRRRRRRRRAGLVGAARPAPCDRRRLPAPAAPRAASSPRRPSAPSRSGPSLPPWRNMAAAAASASQDELSKCHRQPAAASQSRRCAGPGAAAGARRAGRRAGARCRQPGAGLGGRAAAAACGGLGRSGLAGGRGARRRRLRL